MGRFTPSLNKDPNVIGKMIGKMTMVVGALPYINTLAEADGSIAARKERIRERLATLVTGKVSHRASRERWRYQSLNCSPDIGTPR